jgi:hypothetical protein
MPSEGKTKPALAYPAEGGVTGARLLALWEGTAPRARSPTLAGSWWGAGWTAPCASTTPRSRGGTCRSSSTAAWWSRTNGTRVAGKALPADGALRVEQGDPVTIGEVLLLVLTPRGPTLTPTAALPTLEPSQAPAMREVDRLVDQIAPSDISVVLVGESHRRHRNAGRDRARLKLPVGARGPLVATAIMSDGTTLPATDLATWSSGAPAVAVISNAPGSQGTASALAVGTTTVTATVLGVGGTAELTVTSARLASISVRPERPSVAVDGRAQLTATGAYDDVSTFDLTNLATWTSSATAVAAVSNVDGTRGQVTGLAAGTASIEAHIGTVSARAQLSVTR